MAGVPVPVPLDRDAVCELDAADPLAGVRERFVLPLDLIYLDGNSLGALPAAVPAHLYDVVHREWGKDLIRSWNSNGWWEAPLRVGAKLAPIIGAHSNEVVVCDSTSVNIFKLAIAGMRLRPDRRVILAEGGTFPTDHYMLASVAELLGVELRIVPTADLYAAITDEVALVSLTNVDYRTGAIHNLEAVTQLAHDVGAVILWDLAHSAGVLPMNLHDAGADLAVGCGYKFLNGGPGAPAFCYVHEALQDQISQPLPGWLGHVRPFDFEPSFDVAPGMARLLTGTSPILSLLALDAALDAFGDVSMQQVREKSMALTELTLRLVDERVGDSGFGVVSPLDPQLRGSQVSLSHPHAFAITQALIARGVIGDFRTPDILRLGFAPMYVRYVDVWDAVTELDEVMQTKEYLLDRHQARATVT
jgi:kynureninase